jgi:hypothetical protein
MLLGHRRGFERVGGGWTGVDESCGSDLGMEGFTLFYFSTGPSPFSGMPNFRARGRTIYRAETFSRDLELRAPKRFSCGPKRTGI